MFFTIYICRCYGVVETKKVLVVVLVRRWSYSLVTFLVVGLPQKIWAKQVSTQNINFSSTHFFFKLKQTYKLVY